MVIHDLNGPRTRFVEVLDPKDASSWNYGQDFASTSVNFNFKLGVTWMVILGLHGTQS